jgi:sirohydrochlorin ferrochelatase
MKLEAGALLAHKVSAALPERSCIASFLELVPPSLQTGIEELVQQGVCKVTVMPVMLMAAGHVKNDIPAELKKVQAAHPEVKLVFGRDLRVHPKMLQVIKARIKEIEPAFCANYDRKKTLLLSAYPDLRHGYRGTHLSPRIER